MVVLEKTLESPLDCKEIKPVNPEGNKLWILIRRSDAEAPILWSPDVKSWLIGKDPDTGKGWVQEEKRVTEDKMIGCPWLNAREFEQTLGDSEGQGSLMCCSPWGRRVGHDEVTEQQQLISLSEKILVLFCCSKILGGMATFYSSHIFVIKNIKSNHRYYTLIINK